jgi:hypothetical protein
LVVLERRRSPDYVEANGIRVPTKRRAYMRGPDRRSILDELMVASDLSDVTFRGPVGSGEAAFATLGTAALSLLE